MRETEHYEAEAVDEWEYGDYQLSITELSHESRWHKYYVVRARLDGLVRFEEEWPAELDLSDQRRRRSAATGELMKRGMPHA